MVKRNISLFGLRVCAGMNIYTLRGLINEGGRKPESLSRNVFDMKGDEGGSKSCCPLC